MHTRKSSFSSLGTQEQTRRDYLRTTAMAAGLSLPQLLQTHVACSQDGSRPAVTASVGEPLKGFGKAKSVIMLWLLGGISQVESWDPKPEAPQEVRGEFGVIDSIVPGISLGELLPKTSRITNELAILRAMVTNDNGHSSSGYHMLTGVPHVPPGQDNLGAVFPNFAPSRGALVRAIRPDRNGLPAAITLPYHVRTDAGTSWPGQGGGDIGMKYDPWLLNCDPSQPGFQITELELPMELDSGRLSERRRLLNTLRSLDQGRLPSSAANYVAKSDQAFELLTGAAAQQVFNIEAESTATRDRYGRHRFGQSTLLARRLAESGVSLIQVNWTRVEGYENEGAWDTHGNHCKSAKGLLMPMFDQTFSALVEDLRQRDMLEDTLVIALSEFGRTPRFNKDAGRDHWGTCFSLAMAGAGVQRGIVYGRSDSHAANPLSGIVSPADLSATIFHLLGHAPDTIVHEQTGRPIPLSRGRIVQEILA
ncbi:MAG: DUF1501 domain-containing protein [Planctomyces sp.]|nr:DUF1501 domain-containing protein [Planctomyces sp.]